MVLFFQREQQLVVALVVVIMGGVIKLLLRPAAVMMDMRVPSVTSRVMQLQLLLPPQHQPIPVILTHAKMVVLVKLILLQAVGINANVYQVTFILYLVIMGGNLNAKIKQTNEKK